MRTRTCVLFSIFLLVAAVIFVSASCDNGASSGTLTVAIAGAPEGADGSYMYIGMFAGGADPLTSSILGTGEILLSAGASGSTVMEDVLTEGTIFDPGNYDLYAWIDMNGNFETVMEPEQDTDMTAIAFPVTVTVNGDTTFTYTSASFELFPGWD